jgi:hypothetical protein
MECPHAHEVGDPPSRSNCSARRTADGRYQFGTVDCPCDDELMIIIRHRRGPLDEQAEYVARWWRRARAASNEAEFERLKESRPRIILLSS